jgi:hypothetical protein
LQRGPDVIATPPGRIPPMQDSDEADQTLLRLAREQGAATEKALEYMLHQQAVAGQETRAGDYLVAYAVEYAEGFYARAGDELSYQRTDASAETNVHVEVCVRDGADGRFIPGLNVYATSSAPSASHSCGIPGSITTERTGACPAAAITDCAFESSNRTSGVTTCRTGGAIAGQ